jgi:hypothetical protein
MRGVNAYTCCYADTPLRAYVAVVICIRILVHSILKTECIRTAQPVTPTL